MAFHDVWADALDVREGLDDKAFHCLRGREVLAMSFIFFPLEGGVEAWVSRIERR